MKNFHKRVSLVLVAFSFGAFACKNDATSSAPPAPEPAADAGPSTLTLAAGEAAEFTLSEGHAAARLATPTGTEEFVAIVASTELTDSDSLFKYSVSTDAVDTPTDGHVLTECTLSPDRWQTASPSQEVAPSGTAPVVGATKSIHMGAETISVEVAAVTDKAVVWIDKTAAHPATLDAPFIDGFLSDFETIILPREREMFGIESDLDHDGRISLVFTPLTKNTAVAFFDSCDLHTPTDCGESNQGEYLYLTPPANIDPPYNTPAAMKEILAHELGHLVHYNRKALRNHLGSWPDSSYMIEGFGAFAQDVIGYQAGNLYVTMAGLDQITDFSIADVLGDRHVYDDVRDGPLRGGSYLFVRFMYDRAGGDTMGSDGAIVSKGGPTFLHALLDAPGSVAETLPTFAKGSLSDITADFYTALALSNADKNGGHAPTNPCFAFLPAANDPLTGKPRGADLFASFHGQSMKGPAMQAASEADGKLRGGGVEYLKLTSNGAPELDFTVTVDAKAAARVRVARLK